MNPMSAITIILRKRRIAKFVPTRTERNERNGATNAGNNAQQ